MSPTSFSIESIAISLPGCYYHDLVRQHDYWLILAAGLWALFLLIAWPRTSAPRDPSVTAFFHPLLRGLTFAMVGTLVAGAIVWLLPPVQNSLDCSAESIVSWYAMPLFIVLVLNLLLAPKLYRLRKITQPQDLPANLRSKKLLLIASVAFVILGWLILALELLVPVLNLR